MKCVKKLNIIIILSIKTAAPLFTYVYSQGSLDLSNMAICWRITRTSWSSQSMPFDLAHRFWVLPINRPLEVCPIRRRWAIKTACFRQKMNWGACTKSQYKINKEVFELWMMQSYTSGVSDYNYRAGNDNVSLLYTPLKVYNTRMCLIITWLLLQPSLHKMAGFPMLLLSCGYSLTLNQHISAPINNWKTQENRAVLKSSLDYTKSHVWSNWIIWK